VGGRARTGPEPWEKYLEERCSISLKGFTERDGNASRAGKSKAPNTRASLVEKKVVLK